MTKPYTCSASQVRTAEDCLRKWGFDKLDRIPRIPHPSAALGSAVHAQLEVYLRDGTPLDLLTPAGRIAMAGVHLLPKPPFLVETRLDFELDGVPFVSFVDILSPGVVHDHKTTGDLRWCLTVDELQGDTQGTLYAHATGSTELHWIYYRTREPHRAIDVTAKVDRMKSDDRLERTARIARTLRTIVEAPPARGAIELPPNPDACDRYGGCPHKLSGRCQATFTDQERLRAFMSTASLLDSLEQRINPPAVPPPTPAAPPVEDLPPPLANGTRDLPPGLFWYRGATGWAAAPDNMREHLDPDGSKSWPRPASSPGSIEALASDAKEKAILALPTLEAQLDAALALGDAEDAAAATNPLASVLASANAANPSTELGAILGAAKPAPAGAKRGGKPRPVPSDAADDGPDLDPRVRVIHDPEANELPDVPHVDPARFDPPAVRSGRTSSRGLIPGVDPVVQLRSALFVRAEELIKNASADELVSLASLVEKLS